MAEVAYGTTFDRAGTVIPGVTTLNGLNITSEAIGLELLNPASGFREYISGIKNNDPITVGFNASIADIVSGTSGMGLLRTDVEGTALAVYKIIWPGGQNITWTGCVASAFGIGDMTDADKIMVNFIFQPSGPPAFAAT